MRSVRCTTSAWRRSSSRRNWATRAEERRLSTSSKRARVLSSTMKLSSPTEISTVAANARSSLMRNVIEPARRNRASMRPSEWRSNF